MSTGGSGSVGWCGVGKTQPSIHTSALPQLMPGAACHPAAALPTRSACPAGCWAADCAAVLPH